MIHELVHQWWGLGNMFDTADPNSPWSAEGLTCYTTYRIAKQLYGEDYAQTHYVEPWQQAVDDYYLNFYVRHPEYLERLPEETAWRGQTLAAGLMVDIDFFKQYNDTYGHVAGDSCLKSIADDIQVFIRDKNACAVRYGGEEFFICLFQCEAREAWAEAEKLRQSIQDSGFRRDDVPLGCVTVSIGVSVLENWQTDMELLIRRADVALYAAKSNGRNRVMAYEESIPAHGRA